MKCFEVGKNPKIQLTRKVQPMTDVRKAEDEKTPSEIRASLNFASEYVTSHL